MIITTLFEIIPDSAKAHIIAYQPVYNRATHKHAVRVIFDRQVTAEELEPMRKYKKSLLSDMRNINVRRRSYTNMFS